MKKGGGMQYLKGKKSYIISIIGGILCALNLAGILPSEWIEKLLPLLGFGGLAALRAGLLGK